MASGLLSVGMYIGVQRAGFGELLGITRAELTGDERWLVPASIISTTLILLLPGMVLGWALLLVGAQRASRACFAIYSGLVLLLLLVDLDLLRSIGRHLIEVAQVALAPRGHVAGGELWSWLWMLAEWSCWAIAASIAASFVAERAVAAVTASSRPLLRRVLGTLTAIALIVLVLAPQLMRHGWRDPALYARTYGLLLIDSRLGDSEPDDGELLDPQLRALYPRLRQAYTTAFPMLTLGKPGAEGKLVLPARPPNVVFIVAESLRHDVFPGPLMPRLSHWAEGGLVATAHDSGTIYSESGIFALLYGRNPAVFHQTLDAHVPPQLCVTLRASGYECAYFTGHPKVWMRREEFLNAETMDHFVHDDRGTWPEWDQRALDGMVQLLSTSDKPIFAVVLLMSSHFGYEYPARYEVERPVSNSTWSVTQPRSLGKADEAPHRNRYHNCMRFLDDLVGDAILKLDPDRNLVVFTGDHGESINDDGRYTHGYSFAEIITRTPLALVGPGVVPTRLERATYHVDVLPSLLHVLGGKPQPIPHTHGLDWFGSERRGSALEAHSSLNRDMVRTQLRSAGLRLRMDLDLRRPRVTLLGFEDGLGRLERAPELSEAARDGLVLALEEQLLLLRR
jgi:sulfatase-like protein